MREWSIPTVLVGTGFKGALAVEALSRMTAGSAIRLVREPDNRADPLAVACFYLGLHVGYVSRRVNPRIAEALDRGIPVHCLVREAPLIRRSRVMVEPKLTVTWFTP